jgi:hypothetical protein
VFAVLIHEPTHADRYQKTVKNEDELGILENSGKDPRNDQVARLNVQIAYDDLEAFERRVAHKQPVIIIPDTVTGADCIMSAGQHEKHECAANE